MQEGSRQSGAKDISSFDKRLSHSIIKLTFIYVIILAAILFVSSSVLYSVFSARLETRFRGPGLVGGQLLADRETGEILGGEILVRPGVPNGYPTPEEVRQDLVNLLFLVNGFLLLIAGGLSYKLAEWTLSPLKLSYMREKRFLSDASHELRTPLSILKTELENQLSEQKGKGHATSANAKHIESNLEEVDRMSRIISDLLTLSRMSEDGTAAAVTMAPFNINQLVVKTNERLAIVAKANSINLACELPKEDIMLSSNESLVEAILLNAVKNGINYNKPNGTVMTKLEKDEATNAAIITVTDTGIGMSEEETEKVFERFYRADKSRSRQTGGSGLGLSIVKAALDKIDGTVTVKSEVGKGTTLVFRIPSSLLNYNSN